MNHAVPTWVLWSSLVIILLVILAMSSAKRVGPTTSLAFTLSLDPDNHGSFLAREDAHEDASIGDVGCYAMGFRHPHRPFAFLSLFESRSLYIRIDKLSEVWSGDPYDVDLEMAARHAARDWIETRPQFDGYHHPHRGPDPATSGMHHLDFPGIGLAMALYSNLAWLVGRGIRGGCRRRRADRTLRWRKAGRCGGCGYDLAALPNLDCPECGCPNKA